MWAWESRGAADAVLHSQEAGGEGGEKGVREVCFNKVRVRKKRKCQRCTLIQSVFVDHPENYSNATHICQSVRGKKIKIT